MNKANISEYKQKIKNIYIKKFAAARRKIFHVTHIPGNKSSIFSSLMI